MKRDIYQKLLDWKTSDRREPLLLKGTRQTSKTYILKEFGKNEYENVFYFNITSAGSLLGVKLSTPKSFPVGQVNFLELYPMTFFEFLDAAGESRYRTLLEGLEDIEPVPLPFHEDLTEHEKKEVVANCDHLSGLKYSKY